MATRHRLSETFADPDLVDRMFEYILELLPELAGRADQVKAAVRDEFQGEEVYIAKRTKRDTERDREEARKRVLALYNGRNATTVARQLGIGRTTVFRLLKQAK
jgi:transcriptional regulator of acetoin/glycerol metabolism